LIDRFHVKAVSAGATVIHHSGVGFLCEHKI